MKFRLFYEGPLKSNRRKATEKDHLRNYFSGQLAQVWRENEALQDLLVEGDFYEPKEVGNSFFRPMIIDSVGLRCELDFLILSPRGAGSPLNSGDLDNKLKTLIDGLRQPSQPSEVTDAIGDSTADNPICVLLEDDRLVTRISAQTDLLLGASQADITENNVKVVIAVHLYPVVPVWSTLSLVG